MRRSWDDDQAVPSFRTEDLAARKRGLSRSEKHLSPCIVSISTRMGPRPIVPVRRLARHRRLSLLWVKERSQKPRLLVNRPPSGHDLGDGGMEPASEGGECAHQHLSWHQEAGGLEFRRLHVADNRRR
jgi:hypothetical protein